MTFALSGRRREHWWHDTDDGANRMDFFDGKGIVLEALARAGVHADFEPADDPSFSTGRTAAVMAGQTRIGLLGEVSQSVAAAFDMEDEPVTLAEIDLDAVKAVAPRGVRRYVAFSRYPGAARDLAVIVDADVPAGRIRSVLAGHKLVKGVAALDVYTGEGIPPGKKSIAFGLVLQSDKGTLHLRTGRARNGRPAAKARSRGRGSAADVSEDCGHRHTHDEAMLSVEEALERVLSYFEPLEAVDVPIAEAAGMVLADKVVSDLDVPPLDNSAMDGYAVRCADVGNASTEAPSTLRVVARVAAGDVPTTSVEPGTAIRIMTGAPVPPGTDAVVPFEDTDEVQRRQDGRSLDEISIVTAAPDGANVRRAGKDIRRGQTVLEKGMTIGPAEIGVMASLGRATATVHRRPVVAVLSTGNEITEPGSPLPAGSIYDSNGAAVAAAISEAGGIPRALGTAPDDMDAVDAKIDEGLDTDMLITSAGVSKGDFDVIKDVLARRGQIQFWSVRMRPAKPLAFGLLGAGDGSDRTVPHLGLPGNPVSALVAFEQFGRIAIAKMLGRTAASRPTVRAVLERPILNHDGRRVYARVVVSKRDGTYHASLTGDQSSNLLTSMAAANGLAICPEDQPEVGAGELVDVIMLRWPPEVF